MKRKGSLVNLFSIIGMILAFFVFYIVLVGGDPAIQRSASSVSKQMEMNLMLNPILSTKINESLDISDLIMLWENNPKYEDVLKKNLTKILWLSEQSYEFYGKNGKICTTVYSISITKNIPEHVFVPEGFVVNSPFWNLKKDCYLTHENTFRFYKKIGDEYVYLFKEVKVKPEVKVQ